ncbi:MAG TPA: hypothetical protein VHC22_00710 [Pirellulales bacterium]|nr:hypothetical protein [Pirellulales bacterium]
MTGDRFIDFARKLLVQYKNDPAGVRSTVSRLYYGAYHIGISLLTELGWPPVANENGHQHAQRAFQNSGEQNAIEFGDLLVQLHERRKQADYKLHDERYESSRFGEEAVVRLDQALRAFQKCCNEPARTNIKAGISSYREKINSPR